MTKIEQNLSNEIRSRFNCSKCINEGHCRFGAGYDYSEDCGCNADEFAEGFESGWDKAKSELRKEFEDWFCNGYCRFYGNEAFMQMGGRLIDYKKFKTDSAYKNEELIKAKCLDAFVEVAKDYVPLQHYDSFIKDINLKFKDL